MQDAPFHSFTFTLVADKRPRAALRMRALESGMYELHVERGPASAPTSQFTREVPIDVAQRLKDALQDAGVFGWDELYGDDAAPGSRRWSVSTVFKEGVFSVASKGGSDAPAGFDAMLEELYRLDFPRPNAGKGGDVGGSGAGPRQGVGLGTALNSMGSLGLGSIGGMSAGDLGAYGAVGKGGVGDFDFSKLGEVFSSGDMADMLSDMQSNPQAMQQRMKDEVRRMGPAERKRLIDMLVQSGMGTRKFWEDFFNGL